MKDIKMVDLVGQYEKIKPQVQSAVNNILDNAQFINGPDVTAFKNELATYLDVKHVIPCANGTDALQIALMSLGLKSEDEVILPSFTFIATAEVIGLLGLKPVFVDCERDSFNISIKAIEAAITAKTKVIVPVHLYGQACDMEAILKVAKKYDLKVIEDNAQAIGSDYTFSNGKTVKAGTIGNIGCTSFFPSKNLGGYGDGGAIFTNDDKLADKIQMIANHGQSKRYYHDLVGCNSRLDTIQAAILRIKLKELDNYIDARRKAADYYDTHLSQIKGVTVPYRSEFSKHVFHQYTLQLADEINRDELVDFLGKKGIPAMIYYPVPAHQQKMFAFIGSSYGSMVNTDWLTSRVVSLPMHTELDEEQLKFICKSIKEFVEK
ncbi:MAG: DegT/DnrJ/EryC1/StrS family aminotransferase [Brumimicrobium sp.]|nr:DegT/DnrJ/EryC1/StrS family aminotransferase [Brumimicrobium sp.]